jgi:hypothetical protein
VPIEPALSGRTGELPRTSPVEGRSASSHGSLVDANFSRYAARAKDMAASEIRALDAAGRNLGTVCRDLLSHAAARKT